MTGRNAAFVALILGFVCVTNQWMGWSEGILFTRADDAALYAKIAAAAPAFPVEPMPGHNAQRFFLHYVIGMISSRTSVPVHACYWAFLVLLVASTLVFLDRILRHLGLSRWAYGICISVFVLNPYTLRYYLLAPGMVSDWLLVFGVALVLWGLVRPSLAYVFFGSLVACLGRQTAMLVIPGVGIWMLAGSAWRGKTLNARLAGFLGSAALISVTWFATQKAVAPFSLKFSLLSSLIGFYPAPSSFGLVADHILRVALPEFMFLGLLLGAAIKVRPPVETYAALAIGGGIISQPLLFSPHVIRHNESRLSALGLIALVVGLGFALREVERRGGAPVCLGGTTAKVLFAAALGLSSCHHLYSAWGPGTALEFAVLESAAALVAAGIFFAPLSTKPALSVSGVS